jgi:hypothetical protein
MLVHLADPTCRGHRQSIQKCCGCGYVLAGPGKGGVWRTFLVDGDGDDSCSSSGFGVVYGGGLLRP